MFLSFIVPVYNAERYIGPCLDSLLRQELPGEDFEILCVNDGSTDRSLEILQAYAGKYPSIRLISKENGGVTTARNTGLSAARGDYIWFVDADDLIPENCLSQLKLTAERSHCDRIAFGAYQFTDALTEEELQMFRENRLPINTPWYDAVVWRCLLRRDFLQAHNLYFRYPELTHGEDGLFMYEVTLHHPDTLVLEDIFYFYREHSGSAETTVTPENRMRKLRSYLRIVCILQQHLDAMEAPGAGEGNKLMSFLWMTLYEACKLPSAQAREVTADLKKYGLKAARRAPQFSKR
ncbi:MAG: glycosyltransferase [Oscillospiraceae bacterium]|nr:glycosyltransferase [Oscillospiraceae bacterium]